MKAGGTDSAPGSARGPVTVNGWWEPDACVFCGSTALKPWLAGLADQRRFVPGRWRLLRCGDCGSAQISPMPSPEKIAELYPPAYSFRADPAGAGKAKGLIARTEEAVFYRTLYRREPELVMRETGITGGSMLDVGCGAGDRLVRFARAGFDVRGLEIQEEQVRYVRDVLGFPAEAGTLDSVSYPEESFDLVSIFYVVEHLLDVQAVLGRINAMLRPGGWIVVGIPLADSAQSLSLRTRWSQYGEAPRHVAVPSREGIRRALAAGGFDSARMHPMSALSCSGAFALSVIPQSAAGHAYGGSGLLRHLPRLAGGALTMCYLPLAAAENRVLQRPALAMVLARKPA